MELILRFFIYRSVFSAVPQLYCFENAELRQILRTFQFHAVKTSRLIPQRLWQMVFKREPYKKRAEPAFTSAEVRHTSKSCSRGRFYAISYTLKKRAEPAFTPAKVRHTSESCSRGRFYAISYTLKEKASHQMGDLKKSANRHSIIGTFLFLPASASGHRTLCESSASAPKCARLCAQPNHTAAARERASRRTH